jgi:hypothetical protein
MWPTLDTQTLAKVFYDWLRLALVLIWFDLIFGV